MSFQVIEGDVVLRDTSGNAIGVVLDGTVYRLQVQTKLVNEDGDEIDFAEDGGQETLEVADQSVRDLLQRIFDELRRMNAMLAYATEADWKGSNDE